MKKFFKVFITILVIVGAVAGTSYLFFKNLVKNSNKTGSIVNMLQSDSKQTFNTNLNTMDDIVNENGLDNRMEVIIETNKNLDKIVYTLSSYYINSSTTINNEKVKNQLNVVNLQRSTLTDMMEEYFIKSGYNEETKQFTSTYFDKNLGLNDFYKKISSYLVNYAKLAKLISADIGNVNKESDVKFIMFDVYADVVKFTFAEHDVDANKRVVVKDVSNLNLMNAKMKIENFYIDNQNIYTISMNNFVKSYNKCNKEKFAKNLVLNIAIANSPEQADNDLIATFYFKAIFEI